MENATPSLSGPKDSEPVSVMHAQSSGLSVSRRARRSIGLSLLCVSMCITGLLAACTGTGSPDLSHAVDELNVSNTSKNANTPAQTRDFTLYVRDTTIKLPGGKEIYAFGYTDNPNGPAKIPGPTFVVNEGDTVNLTLVNDKDPTKTLVNADGDGHTIHLHGLDLPSAMDGDPMTAPGQHPVMQGTRFKYTFVAKKPGTYWYHCHESAAEHVQMGMYGAIVILPKGMPNRAYPDTPTFDKQYTFVLSDMSSDMHQQDYNALHVPGSVDPNWTQYRPNYFFINGKVWPDIMNDPNTFIQATVGQRILIRLVNVGYVVHAIHTHGFHFQVIGTDGRKLASPYEKDTLLVAPAERYDVLLDLDQTGRYMLHDHIETAVTNDGDYMGGMGTYINVNDRNGTNPVPPLKMNMAG